MAAGITIYLVAINVTVYLAFAWDKHCARNHMWRIAESSLLGLAVLGGTVGAFAGQKILRHKTQKEPFRTYLRLIYGVQFVVIVALVIL